MIKYISILFFALSLIPPCAWAGTTLQLRHMQVDTTNKLSLIRGAHEFTNYCLSCHAARQVRYQQLLPGLGLTDKQLQDNLMLPGRKLGDKMKVSMTAGEGKKWFGTAPPDLSDIERVRGADWLYTYLTSFYLDPSRPTGVNNRVFPKVAMPDVLWQQQGLQKPVYKTVKNADGKAQRVITGLKLVTQGSMTPKQFDRTMKDLVNFLAYISAPYKHKSHVVGLWVIALLILFTISAYFLKREYWKDVDH
ncbi:MAG: cytochrome c1 [Gammaproteobacteria bacterium]